MKTFLTLSAGAIACLLASCGTKNDSTAAASPVHKSLSQRLSEQNGYVQDSEGNWKPRSDKRSSFESKGEDANFAKKDFNKSQYHAGDYAKTSFWGNKSYEHKAYAGNTDGSRFQTKSSMDGKTPREAGKSPNLPDGDYKTGGYATNDAREMKKDAVAKGSNAAIENRTATYKQPEIFDYQAQRKMSVEQSKGILGN